MLMAAMLLWNDNLHKLLGNFLLRDLDLLCCCNPWYGRHNNLLVCLCILNYDTIDKL